MLPEELLIGKFVSVVKRVDVRLVYSLYGVCNVRELG